MTLIYIYETAYSKSKGLIKVGQTDQDPAQRIWQQLTGYPCKDEENPFTILYQCEAVKDSGQPFTDKDIHGILEIRGIKRMADTEWFYCTLEEAISAIDFVRKQEGKGNYNIYLLKELLETHKDGLSRAEMAELLHVSKNQVGNMLTQAQKYGVKFARYKEREHRDGRLCVVLYYQLPKYSSRKWNSPVSHSFFDTRSNKFFELNDIDFTEILTLIDGCGYFEAIAKVRERLPQYGRAAIEKLILRIKQPLIRRGYLTMVNRKYSVNLNPSRSRG